MPASLFHFPALLDRKEAPWAALAIVFLVISVPGFSGLAVLARATQATERLVPESVVERQIKELAVPSAQDAGPSGGVTRALAVPGGEWRLTAFSLQENAGAFQAASALVLSAALAGGLAVFMLVRGRRALASQAAMLQASNRKLEERLAVGSLPLNEVQRLIKINLQVILSLLDLQLRKVSSDSAKRLMGVFIMRVNAISLAYEQMQQGRSQGLIPVRSYLEGVLANALDDCGGQNPGVEYELESEGGCIPLGQAVPLGLIITELVTNCLRHAFEGVSTPRITVRFGWAKPGVSVLCVKDNGGGFFNCHAPGDGTSLGLVLVKSLTSQLGGTIRCRNDGGAVVELALPLEGSGHSPAA